jgi:hypothetical protein
MEKSKTVRVGNITVTQISPKEREILAQQINSSAKFRKTIAVITYAGNLSRTIGRNLGDQDPVTPLSFCPEKSSIRCCQEFYSSGSVVR